MNTEREVEQKIRARQIARARAKKRAQRNRLIISCVVALLVVISVAAIGISRISRPADGTEVSNGEVQIDNTDGTQSNVSENTTNKNPVGTTAPVTNNSSGYKPFVKGTKIVANASVGVTGDVLIHDSILKNVTDGNSYNFDNIFPQVTSYFKKYDMMVANLEVTLGGAEAGTYKGYPCFNTPDQILDSLKKAGVDMLLTANNHSYDTGLAGMKRTVQTVEKAGFQYIGTRADANGAKYRVSDINGIKIGMTCYTYETTSSTAGRKALNGILLNEEAGPLINSFDYNNLSAFYSEAKNSINAMKTAGADVIMFYMHWGNEYQFTATSYQKKMAQELCEMGVDVIVGGHPHVVQPFETLVSSEGRETVCIYSIGNSVSNQRRQFMPESPNGHTEDGMIFSVSFEKWDNGAVRISDVNILPLWVDMTVENGRRVYEMIPLDPNVSDWTTLGISNVESGKASFNRTMKIVGDGLNKYRTSHSMSAVKTSV